MLEIYPAQTAARQAVSLESEKISMSRNRRHTSTIFSALRKSSAEDFLPHAIPTAKK
jgi:hypothetical protein